MYKTLLVTDEAVEHLDESLNQISFDEYLRDYPKKGEPRTRILNLCDTDQYLSQGYYCSLLAEARKHQVLPSVKTINRLRSPADQQRIASQIMAQFAPELVQFTAAEFFLFFGKTRHKSLQKLATKIFEWFPAPILKVSLQSDKTDAAFKIERASISDIPSPDQALLQQSINYFTENVWRIKARKKKSRWDMAILVNEQEQDPPSDKEALKKFIKAAEKNGIHAELVNQHQGFEIGNYDALFIRETTAIDHHTYRIAELAEQQGLVVMDDSQSILRCCNKVYLHDAFSYQRVSSPKTQFISTQDETTLSALKEHFGFPMILKMPEGSFSRGVYKVANEAELSEKLAELFAESALVIVQEFMYTDFDWRIGILNGKPIYACRYMMARNHWQIYNHKAKKQDSSGDFEAMPTFEVPKTVLEMAIRAAKCVGQGLYGVDIKERNGKAYVLEVNDNPSIDHGIENAYLGNELYMVIMAEFRRRLEARGL